MKFLSHGNGKSNHNESVLDQNCAKIITSNVAHFYHQLMKVRNYISTKLRCQLPQM